MSLNYFLLWLVTGRYNNSSSPKGSSIFRTLFCANTGHKGQNRIIFYSLSKLCAVQATLLVLGEKHTVAGVYSRSERLSASVCIRICNALTRSCSCTGGPVWVWEPSATLLHESASLYHPMWKHWKDTIGGGIMGQDCLHHNKQAAEVLDEHQSFKIFQSKWWIAEKVSGNLQ